MVTHSNSLEVFAVVSRTIDIAQRLATHVSSVKHWKTLGDFTSWMATAAAKPDVVILEQEVLENHSFHYESTFREVAVHCSQIATLIIAVPTRFAFTSVCIQRFAHDHISPFASSDEIMYRCRALATRQHHLVPGSFRTDFVNNKVRIGDLEVDFRNRILKGVRGTVQLSVTEAKLLKALYLARSDVVPYATINEICWGADRPTMNAVSRKIYTLRKKLANACAHVTVQTRYGVGFCLVDDVFENVPIFTPESA